MSLLNLQSAFGICAILAFAWLLSERKREFPWRVVAIGVAIQVVLALVFLNIPFMRDGLLSLNAVVEAIQVATKAGTSFVFGYVGGAEAPFEVTNPGAMGNFAFQILPSLMVIGALSALAWHWRILPLIVSGMSWALRRTLGIGGAVGVSCGANVFLGTIESPLLIKPYLERLTRSELFIVFTCGMANASGTILVFYSIILGPVVGPAALGHIIIASLLSLPASIIIAMVMIPGKETTPADAGVGHSYHGTMDAVARGTTDGLAMFLQIIAMLIVIVALVELANYMMLVFGDVWGAPLTFQRMAGWVFAPIAWAIGIPWDEAVDAGRLLGLKFILNEVFAYLEQARLQSVSPDLLSARTDLMMLYALCGFANFSSVGITIAGVTVLAPSRRKEIVQLAQRSLISGTLASLMVGATIGLMPY
ncbi:Putative nucleoside permease NupX [Alphaproteobacteria bacterium SO-S41]|nr:Putative nucleoside permease NupX [Alphaproteobacteria bacterium SO-S41]